MLEGQCRQRSPAVEKNVAISAFYITTSSYKPQFGRDMARTAFGARDNPLCRVRLGWEVVIGVEKLLIVRLSDTDA